MHLTIIRNQSFAMYCICIRTNPRAFRQYKADFYLFFRGFDITLPTSLSSNNLAINQTIGNLRFLMEYYVTNLYSYEVEDDPLRNKVYGVSKGELYGFFFAFQRIQQFCTRDFRRCCSTDQTLDKIRGLNGILSNHFILDILNLAIICFFLFFRYK